MLLALAYSKQFEVIDGLYVGDRENVESVYSGISNSNWSRWICQHVVGSNNE